MSELASEPFNTGRPLAASPSLRGDDVSERLHVNMIECDGHGLCAELVPELVGLDEWGYPVVSPEPVPAKLRKHAKRAVTLCPMLALKLAG